MKPILLNQEIPESLKVSADAYQTPAAVIQELHYRFATNNSTGIHRGAASRIAEIVNTSVATVSNWFKNYPLSRTPNRRFYIPLLKVLGEWELYAHKTGRKPAQPVLVD
jgi:hypothetical protein